MSGSGWKKPDEVMKQMRDKKKALQARFSHTSHAVSTDETLAANNNSPSSLNSSSVDSPTGPVKRKNPFRHVISCYTFFFSRLIQ